MKQNDLTNGVYGALTNMNEKVNSEYSYKLLCTVYQIFFGSRTKQTVKNCNTDVQNMWSCFKETEKANRLSNCWFVLNLQIGKLILSCFHIPIAATFKQLNITVKTCSSTYLTALKLLSLIPRADAIRGCIDQYML